MLKIGGKEQHRDMCYKFPIYMVRVTDLKKRGATTQRSSISWPVFSLSTDTLQGRYTTAITFSVHHGILETTVSKALLSKLNEVVMLQR